MGVENQITLAVLATLSIIYIYILTSPSQPHPSSRPRHYVIIPDTQEEFDQFIKEFKESQSNTWGSGGLLDDKYNNTNLGEWGSGGMAKDDIFSEYSTYKSGSSETASAPIVPSSLYRCKENAYVTMRSELNYKYLWMHANENMWMGASATMDTPIFRKAFEVIPVNSNCSEGWVRLREAESKKFIIMIKPLEGKFAIDEWVVRFETSFENETKLDTRYHFLLEEAGFVLNRGCMAFINVMPEAEYSVRGHTGGWDRTKPAGREYGASMKLQFVDEAVVLEALEREEDMLRKEADKDKEYIKTIQSFPMSLEKRYISFGLYGARAKYTIGAIRNAELAKVYFPGWICRYYVTNDVPLEVIAKLKELGSEIEQVPPGMGYSSGMFWRFMIAVDEKVDRYIIRDVDSRLNARDRLAVEEWIQSKAAVHILRDHVNHCITMNGGMWGGVKGAIPYMKEHILAWSNRDEYMADLHFLDQVIWPEIKDKQIAHDSYCCDRFPGTTPFPSKRPFTYQHVGQVFDANDNPRLMDIDGFIRGVPIPGQCRKQPEWIYG